MTILDLRFVERDGKRILQYTKNLIDWEDVPLIMEAE